MTVFDMTPFLFGPPDRRLYGVYHPPAATQRTTQQVLLCPPFGQESVRVHLLYRLLADQLARDGRHVMRFDYHATGESAGADEEATLHGWRDDILIAHEELSRRTRARSTTWLGCRLGATLAVMASQQGQAAPEQLVLWEPVLDGTSYLAELGQAHAEHSFSPFIQEERPSTHVNDEVLGFGVSAEWCAQLRDITPERLNPTCGEICTYIAVQPDAHSEHLAGKLQAHGTAWRTFTPPARLDWFQEEAQGSAVAPPELLRLLASAAKGEAA